MAALTSRDDWYARLACGTLDSTARSAVFPGTLVAQLYNFSSLFSVLLTGL